MFEENKNPEWEEVLNKLAEIREQEDYSQPNVDFILSRLVDEDERIRTAAALTAEGCVFDPEILDLLIDLAGNDSQLAVRKAAVQAFQRLVHESVLQGLEDDTGAGTTLEDAEEWDEIQSGELRENYLRVKNLLFSLLENEHEHWEIREKALTSLSDLGFLHQLQTWIEKFVDSENQALQVSALKAMGKYPAEWVDELARFIQPTVPKPLLLEAISSGYSSNSVKLAEQIENLLEIDDPEIISYALLTLANINRTPNLGETLQKFALHQDSAVQEAAKEALDIFSRRNFSDFMKDEFDL